MALEIVQAGNPVLRQQALPVHASHIGTDKFNELISEMVETMRLAPGIGLAAPQIGLPLQLVVLEDREETFDDLDEEYADERERSPLPLTILINPELYLVDDEMVTFYEGCLSVSGWAAETPRYRSVRVRSLNERGEDVDVQWSGWPARILQHEVDHLGGTLYIDRMDSLTFSTTENLARFDGAGESAQ